MIELVVLVVESDELLDEVVEEGPGLGCISPEHIISIKSHVKERIVKKHTERRTENSTFAVRHLPGITALFKFLGKV